MILSKNLWKKSLFWFNLFITAKAANMITKKHHSDIKN